MAPGDRRRTRWAPVLLMMVAAPWFAELSWGGYPITDLPLIVLFLGSMYGGAALLIREWARCTGRGWPSILLCATAFGVFQAGVVDQSLFNPDYGRYDFQQPVHLPWIGISLYYLVNFVAGHVVASIATPIVLTEACTRRPDERWLGRVGVWVVAAGYVLATVVNYLGVKDEDGHGFQAAPKQTIAALVVATALIMLASHRRTPNPRTAGNVPPMWLLAVIGFVAYLLYLPGESAAALACGIAVIAAVSWAVYRWSRHRAWTDDQVLALTVGSVLVGTVMPFWAEPYEPNADTHAELVADVGTATVCVVIIAAVLWRRSAKTLV